MRENRDGRRNGTRAASALAMSALLAFQLAGTGLPTALAQEAAGASRDARLTEEMEPEEAAQTKATGSQASKGATSQPGVPTVTGTADQGTPSQGEGEMGEEGGAVPTMTLGTQGLQEAAPPATQGELESAPIAGCGTQLGTQAAQVTVSYVDENGVPATREGCALVEAELAGEDPLTLSGGWYAVRGQVTTPTCRTGAGPTARATAGSRARRGSPGGSRP